MLTLKDYAQYMPYGIEGKTNLGTVYKLGTFNNMLGRGVETRTIDQWVNGSIKPILYPLALLTDINSNLMNDINCDLNNQIEIVDFAIKIIGLHTISYGAYEALVRNHVWVGDQSYFEKGLIIDKSKL